MDPLTAATLLLMFAMGCVTILLFNRQLNRNAENIARLQARQQSVEAAFDDVDSPDVSETGTSTQLDRELE